MLKECPYILMSLFLDVSFRSFFITTLSNTRCLFLYLSGFSSVFFPSWDIFRKMSSFVSLILRGHSGEHCHSLLWCKDRPMCNSRFLGSGFLSPRPIPFPNALVGISCLWNCYLVGKTMNSPHYPLLLLFGFSSRGRCPCFVLFFDSLVLFSPVCFHSFLMIFLFERSLLT